MADTDTILLYVYNGETYIGSQPSVSSNGDMTVVNPVKITFTYENTTTSSAKLSWLLSPVFPVVLMAASTASNKPNITYANGTYMKIKAGGADMGRTDVLSNIITAYESITSPAA